MQNIIIMPVLPPGMTPELEIILAEGAGMEPGYSSDKVSISVSASSLSSYSWSSSPLPSLSQLLDAKCSKLITVDKMIIFIQLDKMNIFIQLDKVMEKCNRCRLGQISLQGPWHRNLCKFYFSSLNWNEKMTTGSPLEKLGEATYEEVFVTALKNHGMLSIGLYRLISCIIITNINIINFITMWCQSRTMIYREELRPLLFHSLNWHLQSTWDQSLILLHNSFSFKGKPSRFVYKYGYLDQN